VTHTPPWGDAKPLVGCEVVRTTDGAPLPQPRPAKKKRSPVVVKLVAMNRFLDTTARSLHPSAALVWLMLLRDERGGTARTAVTDLAKRCGLSPRTVKRRLAELKTCGLLKVVEPGTPETGPTTYKLWSAPRRAGREREG
jgi:DNA-binding transcriptional ArsR family regulator